MAKVQVPHKEFRFLALSFLIRSTPPLQQVPAAPGMRAKLEKTLFMQKAAVPSSPFGGLQPVCFVLGARFSKPSLCSRLAG